MSKVLRLDKPLLKGLNIYLILHIFEYLDFQIGINDKNEFELQLYDTITHVPASPHCLYGKWGGYLKKAYFLWKTCQLVIARTQLTDDTKLLTQLSKDLELFDCLSTKTNRLEFMLLYFTCNDEFLSEEKKKKYFKHRKSLYFIHHRQKFVVSNCGGWLKNKYLSNIHEFLQIYQ